ncbi:MAG: DNA topoisomerase IB [Roseivirga sp.]
MLPPEHIHYTPDEAPGFSRHVREGGQEYLTVAGEPVTDPTELKRLKALVIPPGWQNVWISKDPDGHLQATGYDEKGRKQYIYHAEWVAYRQRSKFARLSTFGSVLSCIRARVEKDLQEQGWSKSRVLALIVTLMDHHYLRIGNDYYKNHNQTFGLTTLRRKHLEADDNQLRISYKAKSGKYRNITLKNRSLIKLVLATSDLPGYEVFRYLDESGKSCKIDSQDVNEYLKAVSSEQITAKDFRTWGGTVLAIDYYDQAWKDAAISRRTKLETAIVRRVAKKLGNTMATCREYYIHPKVLEVLVAEKLSDYSTTHQQVDAYRYLNDSEKLAMAIINA